MLLVKQGIAVKQLEADNLLQMINARHLHAGLVLIFTL